MAKAEAEEKGAAKGGDEVIEKPREPMFSKNGLIVLIGSNLLVLIIVVLAVFMMSGGDDGEVMMDEEEAGKFDPGKDSWLLLESITTPVPMSGGQSTTVRYSLGIRFDGEQTAQTEAITNWQQGNNEKILRGMADDVMKKYDLERVRDESFKRTYAAQLKKELNLNITDKIDRVYVYELRYD